MGYMRLMTAKRDQRIPVMMSAAEVAHIDQWRAQQPGVPSRSEAIRRLVDMSLPRQVKMTDLEPAR